MKKTIAMIFHDSKKLNMLFLIWLNILGFCWLFGLSFVISIFASPFVYLDLGSSSAGLSVFLVLLLYYPILLAELLVFKLILVKSKSDKTDMKKFFFWLIYLFVGYWPILFFLLFTVTLIFFSFGSAHLLVEDSYNITVHFLGVKYWLYLWMILGITEIVIWRKVR